MNKKRPINLNLMTIKFPIPAIVSILHRVSGVVLFLMLPFFLWVFSYSLSSEGEFDHLQRILSSGAVKFLVWLLICPLCFHLVAGIRHLLMDTGIGDDLKSGRLGAKLTLVLSVVLIIAVGVWLL